MVIFVPPSQSATANFIWHIASGGFGGPAVGTALTIMR